MTMVDPEDPWKGLATSTDPWWPLLVILALILAGVIVLVVT